MSEKIDNKEIERVIDLLRFMLTEANRLREYVGSVELSEGIIRLGKGFNSHVNLTLHSTDIDLFLAIFGWLRERFGEVTFAQYSTWYTFHVADSKEFPRL